MISSLNLYLERHCSRSGILKMFSTHIPFLSKRYNPGGHCQKTPRICYAISFKLTLGSWTFRNPVQLPLFVVAVVSANTTFSCATSMRSHLKLKKPYSRKSALAIYTSPVLQIFFIAFALIPPSDKLRPFQTNVSDTSIP